MGAIGVHLFLLTAVFSVTVPLGIVVVAGHTLVVLGKTARRVADI